jgi:hypothetical protein
MIKSRSSCFVKPKLRHYLRTGIETKAYGKATAEKWKAIVRGSGCRVNHPKASIALNFITFSYGKQSLEAVCFHRGLSFLLVAAKLQHF